MDKFERGFPSAGSDSPKEEWPDVPELSADDLLAPPAPHLVDVHADIKKDSLRIQLERDEVDTNHISKLYDQNEDIFGEKVDWATGEPIDNSGTNEDIAHLTEIELGEDDALPPLEEDDDAAAEWLRKNA